MTNNVLANMTEKDLYLLVCERWALNDIILSSYYIVRINRNNFQNYSNIFNFLVNPSYLQTRRKDESMKSYVKRIEQFFNSVPVGKRSYELVARGEKWHDNGWPISSQWLDIHESNSHYTLPFMGNTNRSELKRKVILHTIDFHEKKKIDNIIAYYKSHIRNFTISNASFYHASRRFAFTYLRNIRVTI